MMGLSGGIRVCSEDKMKLTGVYNTQSTIQNEPRKHGHVAVQPGNSITLVRRIVPFAPTQNIIQGVLHHGEPSPIRPIV